VTPLEKYAAKKLLTAEAKRRLRFIRSKRGVEAREAGEGKGFINRYNQRAKERADALAAKEKAEAEASLKAPTLEGAREKWLARYKVNKVPEGHAQGSGSIGQASSGGRVGRARDADLHYYGRAKHSSIRENMTHLEKYAAKKNLSEALALALYGEKPVAGKTFGRFGAGIGGLVGAERGVAHAPVLPGVDKLSDKLKRVLGEEGAGTAASIADSGYALLGGGTLGLLGGRAAGKKIDELLLKKQMAKYLKRKQLVNAGLVAGGGGAGLAGLAALSNRS